MKHDDRKRKRQPRSFDVAIALFRERGGVLRTGEILKMDVHPRTLYALQQEGIIHRLGRGIYALSDAPPLGNLDFVMVSKKAPKGVICLISALAFHNLTTQIPHEVYLALPRGSEYPRIAHPPIRVFQMTGSAFQEGIDLHEIDGVRVRIYSPEKTIADCFKFRNRIGTDSAVEALRFYRERRKPKVSELLRCAAVCRVEGVMRPYLEAII